MRPWHLYGVLGLVVAGLWWIAQPEEPSSSPITVLNRPAVSRTAPVAPTVAPSQVSPSANTAGTVSAVSCKSFKVSGSHTAEAQTDAQDGAVEEMADICSSHRVTQVQQHCKPHSPEPGVFFQHCRAEGHCQLCGEHFARYQEIQTENP